MNKGWLRGFGKSARKRPWVYIPVTRGPADVSYYCAPTGLDGGTTTADIAMTVTPAVGGRNGIPMDGSVRAFKVLCIARNTTVASCAITAESYNPAQVSPRIECYTGKVASVYESNIGMVVTGGLYNTQFRYGVSWVSGTLTYFFRIVGYWVEADS